MNIAGFVPLSLYGRSNHSCAGSCRSSAKRRAKSASSARKLAAAVGPTRLRRNRRVSRWAGPEERCNGRGASRGFERQADHVPHQLLVEQEKARHGRPASGVVVELQDLPA